MMLGIAARSSIGKKERYPEAHGYADQERNRGGDERPHNRHQRTELFGDRIPLRSQKKPEPECPYRRQTSNDEREQDSDQKKQNEKREKAGNVAEQLIEAVVLPETGVGNGSRHERGGGCLREPLHFGNDGAHCKRPVSIPPITLFYCPTAKPPCRSGP
jgi:hypothetical protein